MLYVTLAVALIPIFVAGAALFFYRRIFPRPLPGILYNSEAITNVLGDIPSRRSWHRSHGEVRRWYQAQCLKHKSPVTQIFIYPLKGHPSVLL
jgi:hypothetical protein